MMHQQRRTPETGREMAHYFDMTNNAIPTQQETLGQIVTEILRSGKSVDRKTICSKLLTRLEQVADAEMEKHYHDLLALVLGREQR